MITKEINNNSNINLLPKYNCSNCSNFCKKQEIFKSEIGDNNFYAMECDNFVHPLEDCVLRGFEGHSEQSGFSQTINKKRKS